MDDFEYARAAARALADKNIAHFNTQFDLDTAGWKLELDDQKFLALITTGKISGRALLCNNRVQRCAQNAMIDAAMEAYRRGPTRQSLWITIAWDRGITWEREPNIDMMSLRRIVYGHLSRCGLEGCGIIEFDTWKNITGEPGRRIVAHSHFIGWPQDGQRIKIANLKKALKERRALPNSIGARSVVIEPVKPTIADFARVGRYMFKRPAFAKMYRPEHDDLKPVGHARGSVARLVEIYSRLEVGDALFSIGDGREIANKVRQAVAHSVKNRRGATPAPDRDEVRKRWRSIRSVNGSKLFREPVIITRKEDRRGKQPRA